MTSIVYLTMPMLGYRYKSKFFEQLAMDTAEFSSSSNEMWLREGENDLIGYNIIKYPFGVSNNILYKKTSGGIPN